MDKEKVSPDAHLEALIDFSKQIRNRITFFVLFNIYAFFNVLSTTDRDIFLLIPKKMPLLNIELPLIAFYIVIPGFIVALHFNLLYKIAIYRKYLDKTYKEYKNVIDSLPFGIYEEVILGKSMILRFLIKIFFLLATCVFPTGVLIAFWYRFADYHSFPLSSYHLILLYSSIGIVLYFFIKENIMQAIIKIKLPRQYYFILIFFKYFFFISFYTFIIYMFFYFIFFVNVPLLLLGIFLIKMYLILKFRKYIDFLAGYLNIFTKYILLFLSIWFISTKLILPYHLLIKEVSQNYKKTIEDLPIENIEVFIKKKKEIINNQLKDIRNIYLFNILHIYLPIELPILDLKGQVIVNINKEELEVIREYKYKKQYSKEYIKPLIRYVPSIDLSNRNFNFAILKNTFLINVNLENSKLFCANLYEADLSGSILKFADLSGSDLSRANFQNSILSFATLINSDLYEANLSGSILKNTNLCGSNLHNANFFGSVLWNANLSGANLYKTNFIGAWLEKAKMFGACSNSQNCNKPLIQRLEKKTELDGIKNDVLTEDIYKKIIKNWKINYDRDLPKRWDILLKINVGKTTLEWIKIQKVYLGVLKNDCKLKK